MPSRTPRTGEIGKRARISGATILAEASGLPDQLKLTKEERWPDGCAQDRRGKGRRHRADRQCESGCGIPHSQGEEIRRKANLERLMQIPNRRWALEFCFVRRSAEPDSRSSAHRRRRLGSLRSKWLLRQNEQRWLTNNGSRPDSRQRKLEEQRKSLE